MSHAGTWSYPESCDGLLFSSLDAVARGTEIDITAAEGEPGQWFRNPGQACYPQGSASDISRDMLLGLMVYSVHFHRLDILENLWTYGQDHNWKMGRGDDRTVLTPASIGRLARAIRYLGGADHPERLISDIPSVVPGFEGHLSLLGIMLDARTEGGVSPLDLQALRSLASQMPDNALAQALLHKYTDGDQTTATRLLLETWPADRLPTSADWCEEWRVQRADQDPGLQSCSTQAVTHTGGDLLFVASLILGEI